MFPVPSRLLHPSWLGGLASSCCHDVEIWRDGQWQSLGSSQSAEILRQRNDGNLQFAMAMEGTTYHFNLELWRWMWLRAPTAHTGFQMCVPSWHGNSYERCLLNDPFSMCVSWCSVQLVARKNMLAHVGIVSRCPTLEGNCSEYYFVATSFHWFPNMRCKF